MAKKVKRHHERASNIIAPLVASQSDLVFSFDYPNWLKGIKTKDFSTFTKDKDEFLENIVYIFSELFPYVHANWNSTNVNPHCHAITVEKHKDARSKYIDAIRAIHFSRGGDQNRLAEQLRELNLYQIGLKGSVRVICAKADNTLTPLLIDHHHLGFESEKHNQRDTGRFTYCPLSDMD